TVHTEGLEDAQSDIDRLNESMIALLDYLQDGKLDGTYSFVVNGEVKLVKPPEALPVDVEPQQPEPGFTTGWWTPPWLIPTEAEEPEVPEYTGAPLQIPVTLSFNNPVQKFDEDPSGYGLPSGAAAY